MATKVETEINTVEAVEIVKVDMAVETDKSIKTVKPAKVVKADKAVEAVKVIEPVKIKGKRLSRSKRAYVRRMKAEARIAGTDYRPGIQ